MWSLPELEMAASLLSTSCANDFSLVVQILSQIEYQRCPNLGQPATRLREVGARCYLGFMIDRRLFEDFNARVSEALRNSPAADAEKNIKALFAAWFERMDLVARDDFEVQKKLLERAQAKLAELEARLAELEKKTPG
jgi:ubiquinone biosynthesis accessory factor UbiK